MAWPITPLTTYLPGSMPAIKASLDLSTFAAKKVALQIDEDLNPWSETPAV